MQVKVGIFWVIKGEAYTFVEERDATSADAREEASGKIDSNLEHFSQWDKELAKKFPQSDFATYPRGRVMFDLRAKKHIIYADKCVTERDLRVISKRFDATDFYLRRDEHYRCDKCIKSELPKLYVEEHDDYYKVTLTYFGDIVKRTLPLCDERASQCGLEDILFWVDASAGYCKFAVDKIPSSKFSTFFAKHTGIIPRYVLLNKIFYKILDGENRIGANLIELSCNGEKYLIECGTELEQTESGIKLRERVVKKHYSACFITHYHADHAGLLAQNVNCDAIYLGEATFKILKTVGGISEENAQKVVTFSREQTIELNGMSVTPYLCDHSAYDSYMFYFKSDKNSLLYTGDFRSHGRKSFSAFLKRLPQKADTLICEGTNAGANVPFLSERDVENKLAEICDGNAPVFILQSATNIDRIVSAYRATIKSDRVFVMRLAQTDICSELPNIPQPNGFKKCYAYSEFPLSEEKYLCYAQKYGKRFIGREGIAKLSRFVLEVTSRDAHYLQKLAESVRLQGAKLVYSTWSGYKEREDMKSFLESVKALGIDVIDLHASGHATRQTIEALKRRVAHDEFVQIHKPREE